MNFTWRQINKIGNYLPAYVYDYEKIRNQVLSLKKRLPENIKIFYSIKANPNISIIKIMRVLGLGGEVVSLGEFLATKKARIKAQDVIYAGGFKTNEELKKVIKENIGLISLESFREAKRTNQIAKNLKKRQKVILRICTGQERGRFKKYFSFTYGIPIEDLNWVIPHFKKLKNLKLLGLHLYEGSRVLDSEFLLKKTEELFKLVDDLERKFAINLQTINIGGGFGIRNFPLIQYGRGLRGLVKRFGFEDREIILELGRYLVAESGTFVTEIIEKKETKQRKHLIVKGLMNCLLRVFDPKGGKGRVVENFKDYPIFVLQKRKSRRLEKVRIFGQLSSVVDSFGLEIELPKLNEEDFILIQNIGGYGLTQAFSYFGSREMATEFLFIDGGFKLIRDKGKPEDFLINQNF